MSKKIKVALIALLVVVLGAVGFMFSKVKSDKIAENVIVNGINLGGMTKEEAKNKIKVFDTNEFTLSSEERSWKLNLDELNFEYDISKTVENAYKVDRSGNIFSNMFDMAKSMMGHETNVRVAIEYDKAKAKEELDKIRKDVDREKENAKINTDNDKITIVPEKNGVVLNEAETNKAIEKRSSANKFKTEAVVKLDEPKIKKSDLEGMDKALGTSVTTFKNNYNRTENIKIATNASSGVILKPGQEYSFNTIVGKRNKANGYKSAPVIVQGEMQEDLGGGVCQVSSTLYNAALKSGMEIVNVKNHTIPSSYVGMGRDATVTDSGIDFVFKNPYKHNVYIQNYVTGGSIVCQVFGSKADEQNIEIQTKTISVSQATPQKVEKSDLPAGKEEVDKASRNGYVVETYRIYKDKNGKQIKKEKIATSSYPKQNGVIFVGTAPVEEKPAEPQNPGENNSGNNGGGETQKPDGNAGNAGNTGNSDGEAQKPEATPKENNKN